VGVLGDSSLTADDVLESLRRIQPASAEKYRTEQNALAIKQGARWRDVETPDLSTGTSIDPRVMSRELDSVLPADRIVAVDSGNFMGYPSQYLAVPDENRAQTMGLSNTGLTTMLVDPLLDPVRNEPRFRDILRLIDNPT